MRQCNCFSLIEIMICLAILSLFIVSVGSFFPKISSYQFDQNQKRIEKFFFTCRQIAILEQRDLILELKNVKKNLSVEILSEEGSLEREKIIKKRLFKHFSLKGEKKRHIYFSSTGWIFPMESLHFIGRSKVQKKEYDLSLYFSLEAKEEKIERIYPSKS